MRERRVPVSDFDQRVVSFDHPQLVQSYRSAREIALRRTRRGQYPKISGELVRYRALFE